MLNKRACFFEISIFNLVPFLLKFFSLDATFKSVGNVNNVYAFKKGGGVTASALEPECSILGGNVWWGWPKGEEKWEWGRVNHICKWSALLHPPLKKNKKVRNIWIDSHTWHSFWHAAIIMYYDLQLSQGLTVDEKRAPMRSTHCMSTKSFFIEYNSLTHLMKLSVHKIWRFFPCVNSSAKFNCFTIGLQTIPRLIK